MKKLLNLSIFIWMNLGLLFHSNATHIVGTDLFYECINPAANQYRITLTMYRDCFAGQAPFDNPVQLFVFNSSTGQIVQNINIPIPPTTPVLEFENLDIYTSPLPSICVEEGVYTTVVQLPPLQGGYDIAWTRCCRNAAIDNLKNPLAEGATFLAHIPDPAIASCNSMPQYDKKPPFLLCRNQLFSFDFSGTDPDGDSLSYALANPYTGINDVGIGSGNPNQGGPPPVVDPASNPMGPPPYRNVEFIPPFSYDDPLGSGDVSIDPVSGFFTATPNRQGIFVFAFSVFEWRDGVLISENRRDLQLHVIECSDPISTTEVSHDLSGTTTDEDTILAEVGIPFSYETSFSNSSPASIIKPYPVSSVFVSRTESSQATFSYTGSNPVQVQVSWQPSCEYAGQVVPLIIGAESSDAFPNVANTFDTVYVRVAPPENIPPEILTFTHFLDFEEDTILVKANEFLYYPIVFIDHDSEAPMSLSLITPDFPNPSPPTFNTFGDGPIIGELRWNPDESLAGQVIPLYFQVTHSGECMSSTVITTHTIYVKVQALPVAPPPPNGPRPSTYPSGPNPNRMLSNREKVINQYHIKVFPNPAKHHLNIEFDMPISQSMTWKITDMAGRTVRKGVLEGETNAFRIGINEMATGQYVLSIGGEELGWAYKRIEVLR